MTDSLTPQRIFERLDQKLDSIVERLGRIEANLERHDERSMNHHERIVVLEQQQRKATIALAGACLSVLIALIPLMLQVL